MKLTMQINDNLKVTFDVLAINESTERGECISIDEIDWNGSLYTEKENEVINDYIWENGGWENILDEIKSNN